jgi:hypothetical protein
MLHKVRPSVPDREALRALYDKAVAGIQPNRACDLTAGFYAQTGDAVFNAGCLALSDAITDTHRMHTVSAPAGGGKTSFSYALVAAVTRYANERPDAPYGTAFVVDQIEKADTVFRDINALLPGFVTIWTSDHDRKCKQPLKITTPAAKFEPEALRRYPVAVVTHAFYLGTRGHNARGADRNGSFVQRALTIVDERPEEAPSLDLMLSEAQRVREALIGAHPEWAKGRNPRQWSERKSAKMRLASPSAVPAAMASFASQR